MTGLKIGDAASYDRLLKIPGEHFLIESSGNLGGTWDHEMTSSVSFHALRLARQASAGCERLYRVTNTEVGSVLLHFRRGMPVYEERGWN